MKAKPAKICKEAHHLQLIFKRILSMLACELLSLASFSPKIFGLNELPIVVIEGRATNDEQGRPSKCNLRKRELYDKGQQLVAFSQIN